MKKIFLIILIPLFLTGCNSYIELNDLGIINKIGIEKENNNYKLYASIIKNTDENKIENEIYSVTAKNIPDLIENLALTLNKKIYLSHLDLLIINHSIKTNELKELITFFLNNNDTHNSFLIINTDNIQDLIANTEFKEVNNLIEINTNETSKSIKTTMFDIATNYYLNKPIYIQNIGYNNHIYLNGFTKLYNNKQEIIDNNESIFINYLLNNINSYKENLLCDNNQFIYLEILSSNTNFFNNKLIITNEIKIINDECKLNKDEINKLFSKYLKDNLSKYTNQKITINNNIRGLYENN